jgi:outer membrane protein insertion porin family
LGPPNAEPIAPSPPYAGQPVPPYPDAGTLMPAAPGAVPIDPTPGAAVLVEPQVVEVRIVGNETVKTDKVLQHLRTRAERPFRMDVIERDVRELNKTGLFVDIRTSYQEVPGGRVVIFEVVERPTLRYVKYVGWQKVKEKTLAKESGLKAGAAADPYAVEEARRTLEEYYHEKGFGLARVTIKEGNKPGDRGAIFVIHEGPKQKVAWTGFIGNTIANDDRLRTQIQSKQGIFWVFKGEFSRKEIEEDKNRLTAYYRGLGFFRARVGDEVTFSASQEWAFVTFVIDEGPRYTIRDVSCIGNTKFLTDDLVEKLKLQSGEYFNQAKMDADIRALEEKYGSVGYIFTDVKAEPRFLERPGELDIVYEFSEGDRYRVGKILPEIKGEYPHTKITTVLNRISLQPGDIVDIRELRASERRLQACGLFEVNPQEGVKPKIVFSPVDAQPIDPDKATEHGIARPPSRPDGFRGQSPDEAEPAADGWLEPSRQGAWPFFTRRR